jgi:hypothetical protein
VKRLLSVAIAVLSAAIALPAHAEVQVYKDSSGAVYISGLQPSEFVKIAYGGLSQKIQVRPSGTCNYLKIPYKASEPGFYPWNGVSIYPSESSSAALTFTGNNLTTVDIAGKSLCDGTGRNTSLNWTTLSGGAYGLKDDNFTAVYIVGLPYKLYDAKDGLPAIRRQKANSCGILKISNTPAWPASKLETFYFYANSYLGGEASGDYNPATLPEQNPEFCRNGILYRPSN